MFSQLDPVINNISLVSKYRSERELGASLTADPSGTFLLDKEGLCGRIITSLTGRGSLLDICIKFFPLFEEIGQAFVRDFFYCSGQGEALSKRCITRLSALEIGPKTVSKAITFTKSRFDAFEEYLLKDGVPLPSKSLLALSFSKEWEERFERLHRFFGYEGTFPSLLKAQREIAPQLIEEVSGTKIPWQLLKEMVQEKEGTQETKKTLAVWCKDLGKSWEFLSPFLFIRLFESIILSSRSEYSKETVWTCTFELTRFLYDHGLVQLIDGEYGQFEWEFRKSYIPLSIGKQIPIEFPLSVFLRAYEVSEEEKFASQYGCECMALVSSSPLFLSVWYGIADSFHAISPIRRFSCDSQGRYAIVEKVIACLDDDFIWEKASSEINLLRNLTHAVHRLLFERKKILSVKPQDVFVTSHMELRIVVLGNKRLEAVSLHNVEKFVVLVCKGNQNRICHVLNQSHFFAHSQAIFFDNLLKSRWKALFWAGSGASEKIRRAISAEAGICKVDREVIAFAYSTWAEELRDLIPRIRLELRNRNLDSDVVRKKSLEWIAESISALQKEMGFVTLFPEDIHRKTVDWIEEKKLCLNNP